MNDTIRTTLYALVGGVSFSVAARYLGTNREVGMAIGSAIGTILATETRTPINGVKKRRKVYNVRLCSS